MRRRDIAFLCLAWGGFLAALYWALSTQFRWVRENKPIDVKPALLQPAEPVVPEQSATGVTGTVDNDTRESMANALREERKPLPRKQGKKQGSPAAKEP